MIIDKIYHGRSICKRGMKADWFWDLRKVPNTYMGEFLEKTNRHLSNAHQTVNKKRGNWYMDLLNMLINLQAINIFN